MWEQYLKRLWAGALFFWASWALCGQSLTESEIRAWAQNKSKDLLIETLVKVTLKLEELNRLYEEQTTDFEQSRKRWMEQISEAQKEMEEGKRSYQKSVESFERTIQEQANKIQITSKSLELTSKSLQWWKHTALFFASATAISTLSLILALR